MVPYVKKNNFKNGKSHPDGTDIKPSYADVVQEKKAVIFSEEESRSSAELAILKRKQAKSDENTNTSIKQK